SSATSAAIPSRFERPRADASAGPAPDCLSTPNRTRTSEAEKPYRSVSALYSLSTVAANRLRCSSSPGRPHAISARLVPEAAGAVSGLDRGSSPTAADPPAMCAITPTARAAARQGFRSHSLASNRVMDQSRLRADFSDLGHGLI